MNNEVYKSTLLDLAGNVFETRSFLAVLNTMLIAIAKCRSNSASIAVASSIEFRELFEYFMNNDPTSLFDELIIQGSHGRIMSRLTVVIMMVGKKPSTRFAFRSHRQQFVASLICVHNVCG